MKKLQNNFTTSEQSKRLLELGVPADSADCCFYMNTNYSDNPHILYKKLSEKQADYDSPLSSIKAVLYPCWSVGRLIEIAKICSKSRYALRGLFLFLDECEADECMSQVMDYFEICNYQFDFSKLEE